MEDELTCSVCLEIFSDPIMLTCSHNFCRECVHKISKVSSSPPTASASSGGCCGWRKKDTAGESIISEGAPRMCIPCPLCGQMTVTESRFLASNRTVKNLCDHMRQLNEVQPFDDGEAVTTLPPTSPPTVPPTSFPSVVDSPPTFFQGGESNGEVDVQDL